MDGLEYGCGRMSPYYNIPQHATMHCPGGWVGIRVLMCADVVLYIYVYIYVYLCVQFQCVWQILDKEKGSWTIAHANHLAGSTKLSRRT